MRGFIFNWTAYFWKLIGGLFRSKLDFLRGEYTFTEVGCFEHVIDTPNKNGNIDNFPQKVWLNIEQKPNPSEDEVNSGISIRRREDVVLRLDIKSVPCKVKWFIIM
jgi:hypothetical protein